MTCTPCEERRRKVLDALLEARIAEAVKQAAIGVKEIINGPIQFNSGPMDERN